LRVLGRVFRTELLLCCNTAGFSSRVGGWGGRKRVSFPLDNTPRFMAKTRADNQMIILSIHLVFENDCARAPESRPQSPCPRRITVWIVERAGHASGRETACTCWVSSSVGTMSPFLPVSAAVLRS